MSHARTVTLEHLPPTISVHAALFTNLQNAPFLRQQLLAGNADFEYALVDAASLVSARHALAAVYRAVNDLLNCRLKSRNVHSEVVFSLSPNNNIADSFRRFGITDDTQHLLCVKVSHSASPTTLEHVQSHLQEHVQGDALAFDDHEIAKLTDWAALRKVYKLNAPGSRPIKPAVNGTGPQGVTDAERAETEVVIVGIMALKGS